jgi:hypothetical protein
MGGKVRRRPPGSPSVVGAGVGVRDVVVGDHDGLQPRPRGEDAADHQQGDAGDEVGIDISGLVEFLVAEETP